MKKFLTLAFLLNIVAVKAVFSASGIAVASDDVGVSEQASSVTAPSLSPDELGKFIHERFVLALEFTRNPSAEGYGDRIAVVKNYFEKNAVVLAEMESLLQKILSAVTMQLAVAYNLDPKDISLEEVQDLVVLALQKNAYQTARAVLSGCNELDILTKLAAAMKPWESSLEDEEDGLLPLALQILNVSI